MNLSNFMEKLKGWNRDVFDHIFYQKKWVLESLEGIAKKLNISYNPFLFDLQGKLWNDLEQVLFREDILWQKKSSCKWLKYRDQNFKFFHLATVIHKRRNFYESLQLEDGEWTPLSMNFLGTSWISSLKLISPLPFSCGMGSLLYLMWRLRIWERISLRLKLSSYSSRQEASNPQEMMGCNLFSTRINGKLSVQPYVSSYVLFPKP